MNKCDCYREGIKAEPRYDQYTRDYVGSVDVKFAYCTGTKEQDECSCGGDCTRCDFYSEVREKAIKEQKTVSGIPVSRGILSDWYIYSVGDKKPVWTEEHLDELFNDFYLIPKEKQI